MKDEYKPHPPGWKVSLSIATGVGWLIFIIVWLAFFAGNETYDFSGYQNFAVILISILVVFMILGGSWASWGIKQIPKEGKEMMKTAGFASRIVVSIIVPLALMIFWIIWFFFFAEDFNIYQNIAIFLVSILAVGGALGAIWAPWGMKHGKKFEKMCEDKEKEK
jgi:magnesium-transporting ATPase (P-type)